MINAKEVLVYVNMTGSVQYPTEVDDHTMASTEMTVAFDNNGSLPPPGLAFPPCNQTRVNPMAILSFYLNGVSTLAVIVLGVVGNTMAIIVLTRRTMKTSTNIFLTALAIWDTVVLAVCLLLISLVELSTPFRDRIFPYIVSYAYPVALAAQTATVWLTVSFTVERYIAVCHPLRAASMCTIHRARVVVMVISLVSVLYNVPRWFEYTILEIRDIYNQSCSFPGKTQLANDPIYHKIYFGWLYFLVMCFIPLCSLAILNSFLIVAVRNSQQQRRDMNVRQSRENNVTIMLVSVVMVFIICQVPALIYNMAYAIDMTMVTNSLGWSILSDFRNFLVTLNSAINFILYCALGQKFRRTFVRTFCPCLVRRMPGRFQSFSCYNNAESMNHKMGHLNGNHYAKVGYKTCRTEPPRDDHEPGMDLKVMKTKYSPQESLESNGSGDQTIIDYDSKLSQRSHMKLLSSGTRVHKSS